MSILDIVNEPTLLGKYGLALFGWLTYMVGKMWYTSDSYDKDQDGMSLAEVRLFMKKNWVAGLFNMMLLIIAVPYAHEIWDFAMQITGKNWPFSEFIYVLIGSAILFLQIFIDIVKWRLKKLKS